jgi:hypothetical protein
MKTCHYRTLSLIKEIEKPAKTKKGLMIQLMIIFIQHYKAGLTSRDLYTSL